MSRIGYIVCGALLSGHAAFAGGVERTDQSVSVIFEEGNYLELSFSTAHPSVTGVGVTTSAGVNSGSIGPSFSNYAMALKMPITEKIDAAFIFDQPFGASVNYPAGTTYFATGSNASLETEAFTGVLRYKFSDRISAYAGLRAQTLEANAVIPFVSNYNAVAPSDTGLGYLVGAAYERPELGMRVSLTYNSKVEHNLDITESTTALGTATNATKVETPQSVNLEFQTGLNPKTLLFGGVRWVNWSDFKISPNMYQTATTSLTAPNGLDLVSFDDDTFTYELGLGRRLNENWSVAGVVAYEKENGGFQSNLAPLDGRTTASVAVTYTQDAFKLTAGVSRIWIGDSNTDLSNSNVTAASFNDNTAWGFGLRAGFSF